MITKVTTSVTCKLSWFILLHKFFVQMLSWKSPAFSAGSAAEKYFHSGLAGLGNIGELMAKNVLGWLHMLWKGISSLFLLFSYPFQLPQVSVLNVSSYLSVT